MDPFTIASYRCVLLALPAYSIILYRGEVPSPRGRRCALVARSVLGVIHLVTHYHGVQRIPLGDANMISAAVPIWTVLIGRVFLKEQLKMIDVFNVALTLVGLVFIIRPPFLYGYDPTFVVDEAYFSAALIVFGGSILQALLYILLRVLKDVHFSVTLAHLGTIGMVEAVVLGEVLGQGWCLPACGGSRLVVLAIGLLSFLAQVLLTLSLQLMEAGKMSILRKAFDILLAFLFQLLIFHEVPGLWSILGALLVTLAVLTNGASRLMERRPEAATQSGSSKQ